MKKLYISLILILMAIAIVVFEPFRSEPPTPEVTINGEKIPTTQGSFCWGGIMFAQCVDFIYTSPLDMAQKHVPTKVFPDEKIEIDFDKEPLSESMKVEQWIDENNIKNIVLKNDSITIPEEKGVYVYHIQSRWKQGDGNYAFSIEVK
ncbi:hypothetical protein ACTL32_08660 [Planococcus sp. FY231025]|uniref:hypothetical protein n=1 Tax=Planococcus sp. FY231025 TaxID=3455699 RepID=UPI003F914A79